MRFLAFIFLILTVAAVFLDWNAVAPDETDVVLRPLGVVWNELHPTSLQQAEPAVDRYVSEGLWLDYVLPVLQTPAAIVSGIAFLFFYLMGMIFRRPRRAYNNEPL